MDGKGRALDNIFIVQSLGGSIGRNGYSCRENYFDDNYVKQVQFKINSRPRKNLSFSTPKDVFCESVAFDC